MADRDDKGRFVPGHAIKGGRKRRADEQELTAALFKELPLSEAAHVLAEHARNGEPWAVKMFFEYAVGVPAQRVQLSGPDDGPIEIDTYDAYERAVAEAAGTED